MTVRAECFFNHVSVDTPGRKDIGESVGSFSLDESQSL
jgi:hypothetical protein